MVDQKNILLVGRTGEDENTLTSLLEENDQGWKIIDATEFSEEGLDDEEVAKRIEEACSEIVKGGLAQILFIFSGRLNKEEAKVYSAIMNRIFSDEEITKITTIVRTKFPDFEKDYECREDLKKLKEKKSLIEKTIKNNEEKSQNVSDLIKIINPEKECKKIIYIYVPSDSVSLDEIYREGNKNAGEIRKKSREKLLKYLETACKDSSYKNYDKNHYLKLVEKIMGDSEVEGVLRTERKGRDKVELESVKAEVELKEICNKYNIKHGKKKGRLCYEYIHKIKHCEYSKTTIRSSDSLLSFYIF